MLDWALSRPTSSLYILHCLHQDCQIFFFDKNGTAIIVGWFAGYMFNNHNNLQNYCAVFTVHKLPYFSIDNAHLMYNAPPNFFDIPSDV